MWNRRDIRAWSYLATAIVGGVMIAIGPGFLVGRPVVHGRIEPDRLVIWTLAFAVAMAWTIVFSTLNFRSSDEFQQQTSRVAWYWGSAIGLAVSLPIYGFISFGGLHWLWPAIPSSGALARAFMTGYGLPVLAQLLGFVVVRTWWRMSKR
jgi:hypothetical protein